MVWSSSSLALLAILMGHSKGISDVAWSSDSLYICSANDDRTVCIWDIRSPAGECIKVLRGHSSFVFYINFNPQSNLIISGSFDETIHLWDVKTVAKSAPSMPTMTSSPPSISIMISPSSSPAVTMGHARSGMLLKEAASRSSSMTRPFATSSAATADPPVSSPTSTPMAVARLLQGWLASLLCQD